MASRRPGNSEVGKHCFTQDAAVSVLFSKAQKGGSPSAIGPLSPVLTSAADGHIDPFGHLSVPNANHW